MLRVAVGNLRPGMVLARPIAQPRDPLRYLVQRDLELTADLIPRLQRLGVADVWVRCRDLEFLEDVIDAGLGEQQRELYFQVRRNFEQVMQGTALELDISHFQGAISGLFDFLKASNCGNVLLQKLDAFDNYLMSHSTNVCYLALLVGMKLEHYLIEERSAQSPGEATDLRHLGLGCLLHDVGKMHIPIEILNKPGKLTLDEFEIIKTHTTLGYEMVRDQAPPAAEQVVLNHHQRWDGKGYPNQTDRVTGEALPPLTGTQIPIFCRIATVADIYDAATSKRVYSDAKPSVQVLYEMKTWCRRAFDPVVERAFCEVVPPFPIGKLVRLSNGVEAVVVDFQPQSPTRPKVQGLRDPRGTPYRDPSLEEIDLALCDELSIVEIDGHDVRPFVSALERLENEPVMVA